MWFIYSKHMIESFIIKDEVVIIPVAIETEDMLIEYEFVVDTGASQTLIDENALRRIGCIPANAVRYLPIHGIGGQYMAPVHKMISVSALGVDRLDMEVLSGTMPQKSGAQGLLGNDFFKNHVLTIDFDMAEISLQSASQYNNCPECHTKNIEQANFCHHCGRRLH